MEITVEISYYPLMDDYQKPVDHFIHALEKSPGITVESGVMSSLVTGPYDEVINLLRKELKGYMEKYPSVFTFKVSNACKACKS